MRTSAPPVPPQASAPPVPPPSGADSSELLQTGDYAIVHDSDSGEDLLSSRDLLVEPPRSLPPPPPKSERFEPDLPTTDHAELRPETSSERVEGQSPRPFAWVLLVIALGAIAAAGYFVVKLGSPSEPTAPAASSTEPAPSRDTLPSAASAPRTTPAAMAVPATTVDAGLPTSSDAGLASADAAVVAADAAVANAAATTASAATTAATTAAPGVFDEARLAELAPLPEPTARIARMRTSSRASRATSSLRSASRNARRRHWDDAKRAYETALRYTPESTEAMHGLAKVALEEEQWDVALAWVQRELAVAPESAEAYLLRGDALRGRGDADAAREAWRKVLELDPRNRDARSRLRRRSGRRR